MKTKNKAQELVNKYEGYVCGYVGSSMLTNTEYPEQILKQAKQCALVAVDEILNYLKTSLDIQISLDSIKYWNEVKQEIEKL